MLDDLTTRDQRMMFAVVTLVHLADSKEELDSDTDALQSAARKHLCQLSTLNWQQLRKPVLYRGFPRFALVGDIFDQASRVEAQAFCQGNVLIV